MPITIYRFTLIFLFRFFFRVFHFSKNLVEKIRISISPPSNRLKFTYSHKLYTFQTENAAIEPLKFQEICEPIVDAASQYNLDDKQDANTQNELAFGQEWTNHKVTISLSIIELFVY